MHDLSGIPCGWRRRLDRAGPEVRRKGRQERRAQAAGEKPPTIHHPATPSPSRPVSASARCLRSISASSAVRTSRPPAEHFRHLRRDRQLDAVLRAELERGARRDHALGHHLHRCENLGQRAAPRELDAHVAIAAQASGARQHEIAEAAQAGERFAAAARPRTPAASAPPALA